MKKNGRVVLLTASPEVILDRVKDSDDRPVLKGRKSIEGITELMEQRRERYEAAADIVIQTDHKLSLIHISIIHIFEELNGSEGILVASKIADRVGITRSVIVNALRKFESAGVIESRSSGMKGTYIKVVNDYVFTELERIKSEKSN